VGDDGEGVADEVVSGSRLQRSTSAAEAGLPFLGAGLARVNSCPSRAYFFRRCAALGKPAAPLSRCPALS
jgi:hypothetical protein